MRLPTFYKLFLIPNWGNFYFVTCFYCIDDICMVKIKTLIKERVCKLLRFCTPFLS